MSQLLTVTDLCVSLPQGRKSQRVVDHLSMEVGAGEVFCVVGESGSGKSMTAKCLMGLAPRAARVRGKAYFEGLNLLENDAAAMIRGRSMGMIFQEPMTALNPVLSIGCQMTEAAIAVAGMSKSDAEQRAVDLLDSVGITSAQLRLRQYPHEFSGGMRQRALIAMAMMNGPRLLIADEPTTALDVTIQAQILALLRSLVKQTNMGLILITHDMGVVAEMADRVLVMQAGKVVETASVHALFSTPKKAYSKALLAAVPRLDTTEEKPVTATGKAIVDVERVSKCFRTGRGWLTNFKNGKVPTQALDDISISINAGEVLGLVGESGSGKSTAGRAVANLLAVDSGVVRVGGVDVAGLSGRQLRVARAKTQMIFQDPYSSLDPRFSIRQTVTEPMLIQNVRKSEAVERAVQLLERVGLSSQVLSRYPHEFSGGQRQRIAIARALASRPSVVVADEPTSALDVSIQAQVLDLLTELKEERSLAMLFISHDLAVVQQVADRVAVMCRGKIVESGKVTDVLQSPEHAYTQLLIASAPVPDPDRRGGKLKVDPQLSYDVGGELQHISAGHWVRR